MLVRTITFDEGDINGLTNLMNQWDDLPAPLTPMYIGATLRRVLEVPGTVLFVCEEDGALVGYACLVEVIFLGLDPYVEVQSILVDGAHRGLGVGRMLMERAESWAAGRGFPKVALSSRVHLEGAHRFYRSLGYEVYKQAYFFSKKPGDGGAPRA
jgi:GNAT superfamily N-acetyltransferase